MTDSSKSIVFNLIMYLGKQSYGFFVGYEAKATISWSGDQGFINFYPGYTLLSYPMSFLSLFRFYSSSMVIS